MNDWCYCTGEVHRQNPECPNPRVLSCEFGGSHGPHDYSVEIGDTAHCPGARPAVYPRQTASIPKDRDVWPS